MTLPSDLQFLPSRIFSSQREYQYFDFFRFQTVTDLSGWFSSYFWHRLVLQMSHSEGVVRRAAVALGALQMENEPDQFGYAMGSSGSEQPKVALQYYNEALSGLRGLLSSAGVQSIDVALTTCILLCCFEVHRKDYGARSNTLHQRIRNPATMARNQELPTLPSSDSLLRTRTNRALFAPGGANRLVSTIPPRIRAGRRTVRREYLQDPDSNGIHDAERSQGNVHLDDEHGDEPVQPRQKQTRLLKTDTEPERDEDGVFRHRDTYQASMQFATILRTVTGECQLALTQWMHAFDTRVPPDMHRYVLARDPVHLRPAIGLHSPLHAFRARCLKGGNGLRLYVQDFDDAVSHALVAIRHHHRHSHSQQQHRLPMFSLSLGVMSSLYFVAVKCRHRSVRDLALYALSVAPLQEGLWNRESVCAMTRVLVEMKESHRILGLLDRREFRRRQGLLG